MKGIFPVLSLIILSHIIFLVNSGDILCVCPVCVCPVYNVGILWKSSTDGVSLIWSTYSAFCIAILFHLHPNRDRPRLLKS